MTSAIIFAQEIVLEEVAQTIFSLYCVQIFEVHINNHINTTEKEER